MRGKGEEGRVNTGFSKVHQGKKEREEEKRTLNELIPSRRLEARSGLGRGALARLINKRGREINDD